MPDTKREESKDLSLNQRITQSIRQKEMHLKRPESTKMQCYVQVPTSPPWTVNIKRSVFTVGKSTAATKTGHKLTCKIDTAEILAFCLQPLNLLVER